MFLRLYFGFQTHMNMNMNIYEHKHVSTKPCESKTESHTALAEYSHELPAVRKLYFVSNTMCNFSLIKKKNHALSKTVCQLNKNGCSFKCYTCEILGTKEKYFNIIFYF